MTGRLALAFLGGCIGGAVRLLIGLGWDTGDGIPLQLLVINLVGSFAIGVVAVVWGGHGGMWPLLGPGLLGGFTTFSGIAAMTWTTALRDTPTGPLLAVAVLAGWMVVCSLAASAGITITERVRQGGPA